ncbi:MAG: GFA family protein [Alphaproteobacteria bacterium]|nr:GFA family protein [Alphaproteobacteria bacterium]
MTTTAYSGGCQCGAVRYSCTAEAVGSANCHCKDCQGFSGSTNVSWFAVPETAVSITGDVKTYQTVSDRGRNVTRARCVACGTPLYGISEGSGVVAITAVSLDDPGWFTPAVDIFTASAHPWDKMDEDTAKFTHMPPMGSD